MLWFTVWTVLVLATLAGALWLGRDLWRKGKALLAELERAADVVGALAERADALTAAAGPDPLSHDVLGDPDEHRARLAGLRARSGRRRAPKSSRMTRTIRRISIGLRFGMVLLRSARM